MKKLLIGMLLVSSLAYGSDLNCFKNDVERFVKKENTLVELVSDTKSLRKNIDEAVFLTTSIIVELTHIKTTHKDTMSADEFSRLSSLLISYKSYAYDLETLKIIYKEKEND